MKKRLLSLFLILILAGCSFNGTTDTKTGGLNNNDASASQIVGFVRPTTQPELNGTIKSIIGNEVTVTARDMSKLSGLLGGLRNNDGGTQQTMTDEQKQSLREEMDKAPTIDTKVIIPVGINMGKRIVERTAQAPTGGNITSGLGAGGGGGFGGGMKGGTGGNRNDNNQGDTADTNGNRGGIIQEASLTDLKVGSRISIWLDKTVTDRKIADSVMVTETKTATSTSSPTSSN